jgi:WD40 repeat protein
MKLRIITVVMALSGSFDCTLKLWDAASGALVRTFEGHGSYVFFRRVFSGRLHGAVGELRRDSQALI